MKKVIFVLFLAVSFGLIINSCGDKTTTTKTEKPDPCAEKFEQVAALQHQIIDLQVQIGDLKAENAKLQADLECCEGKLPASKKTTTTVKRTSTVSATPKATAPATKSATIPTVTAPTETKFVSGAVGGKANLDYLRQDGDIIFCGQANNREDCYFPHYAMQHGVMFSKAPEDNQIKGYNWRVEPTEFYDGDYGVTVDGTFYVADNLIQQSLKAGGLTLEPPLRIKCPYTGWIAKDMSLEDGYWIFRTQRR